MSYPVKITIYARHFESIAEAVKWADEIDGNQGELLRIEVADGESTEPDGVFCEGCEGHMFSGIRWPTMVNSDESHEWVERCDTCERYESDEAALAALVSIYGPDTIASDFATGEATPRGSQYPHPYLDGPLYDRKTVEPIDPEAFEAHAEATRAAWRQYPEATDTGVEE